MNITIIHNHVPVAQNVTINVTKGTPLNGIFNATDADGDNLTAVIVNKSKHGFVSWVKLWNFCIFSQISNIQLKATFSVIK